MIGFRKVCASTKTALLPRLLSSARAQCPVATSASWSGVGRFSTFAAPTSQGTRHFAPQREWCATTAACTAPTACFATSAVTCEGITTDGRRSSGSRGSSEPKPRASIDIRSCLFAEWNTTEEHLKAAFSSGADAVALDASSWNTHEELQEAVKDTSSAIAKYSPSYQLCYLQVDANLTEESSILRSPAERKADLRQQISTLLSALGRPGERAFHGLVLRNVQDEKDVQSVESILEELDMGASPPLSFIPVIETPLSYFTCLHIAEGSSRNVALVGSSERFSESAECQDNSENETVVAVKVVSTLAAHTAGLVSLCGWHSGDEDPARLSRLAVSDKNTGFDGKVILNRPDLVPFVNHLYTVPELEIQIAQELVCIDGGTTRTEEHKDLAGLTFQDPEARTRAFKGPPHKGMAKTLLQKVDLQRPKLEEASRWARKGMDQPPPFLCGQVVDHTMHDRLKVGDIIRCPYELTIDESWITMWHMLIYNPRTAEFSAKHQSRLRTERPVLPFGLAQLLCMSLAVSKLTEKARFHLGSYDSVMVRPLEAGSTYRAFFRVDDRMLTARGYPVIDTTHVLVNQEDKLMFSARKKTMFPADSTRANADSQQPGLTQELEKPASKVRHNLVSRPTHELTATQGQEQPQLVKGQLFAHRLVRYLDKYDCMYFSNLCRLTNDFHINFFKYETEQIIVPGPLVMYSAIGNSLPDLGEQLYHEMDLATHINKFNPGDTVGTLSYIADVKTLEENEDLEEVTVKQIGVKNVDMQEIQNENIPTSLFALDLIKPGDYENICRAHCPILQRRIVVNVVRRFIRVKPSAMEHVHLNIVKQEKQACIDNGWFI